MGALYLCFFVSTDDIRIDDNDNDEYYDDDVDDDNDDDVHDF